MGTRVSNLFPFNLLLSCMLFLQYRQTNIFVKFISNTFFNWDEKLMKGTKHFKSSVILMNHWAKSSIKSIWSFKVYLFTRPNVQSDSINIIDSKRQNSRKICYGSVKCIFLLDRFRYGYVYFSTKLIFQLNSKYIWTKIGGYGL